MFRPYYAHVMATRHKFRDRWHALRREALQGVEEHRRSERACSSCRNASGTLPTSAAISASSRAAAYLRTMHAPVSWRGDGAGVHDLFKSTRCTGEHEPLLWQPSPATLVSAEWFWL